MTLAKGIGTFSSSNALLCSDFPSQDKQNLSVSSTAPFLTSFVEPFLDFLESALRLIFEAHAQETPRQCAEDCAI